MTFRVAGSHDAAKTSLPAPGDIPENDVWEEMIDIMADDSIKFNYVLRAPAGIPYWG